MKSRPTYLSGWLDNEPSKLELAKKEKPVSRTNLYDRIRKILGILISDEELNQKINAMVARSRKENARRMNLGLSNDYLGFFWATDLLPQVFKTKEKLAKVLQIDLKSYEPC